MKLHEAFDGSHPNLIGAYLAACTVYGKFPVGNPYNCFGKGDGGVVAEGSREDGE